MKKEIDVAKIAKQVLERGERCLELIDKVIELQQQLSKMSSRDPDYRAKFILMMQLGKEIKKLSKV